MGSTERKVNRTRETKTLSSRAGQYQRSLENEAQSTVARKGKLTPSEFAEIANQIRQTTPKGVKQTDSTEMVRELRDSDHGGR